jgi:putative membrane protein
MTGLAAWTPYCGAGATPADVLARWNLDPWLIAGLSLIALLLVHRRARAPAWAAFGVCVAIFVSPLCALASALFAARTVHHILLVAVAAPLAVWAWPVGRAPGLTGAVLSSTAVFWAWHAPGAYAWAMSNDAAYWFMQLSLAASAAWFWAAVRGASPLAAIAALLVSTVQMGLLGALLTLADRALYAPHATTTLAWGITALQDQQAAGLIMWAPAAAIYLAVAGWLLSRLLRPQAAPA